MRKIFSFACLALLIFLAGCSRQRQGTELTYMLWGTPGEVATVQRVLDAYRKEHPEIAIKVIHAVDYNRKLNTMIAGGTPPDVFYVNASDLQYYASKGALLDLQNLIERDSSEVNPEDFFPKLMEAFRWQGDLYGLPKDFTPLVMYYNKDMFDEAGLPYPDETWDWRKFLDSARKLTREKGSRGFKQYGFVPSFGNLPSFGYEAFVFQNDGRFLSGDFRECLMNRPEVYEAIQFYADLSNRQHVAPSNLEAKDSPLGLNTGGSAMMLAGRWVVPDLRRIKRFTWDVAPIPHGKKRATLIYTVAYGISARSRNPAEAWKLVKFLTGPRGQTLNASMGLAVPTRKSIAEKVLLNDPLPPRNNRVYLDSISYGQFLPYNLHWNEIQQIINSRLETVFNGEKGAREACEEITIEVNQILKSDK